MKRKLFLLGILGFTFTMNAQTNQYWSSSESSKGTVVTDKAVSRVTFPKEFKLYQLSQQDLRNELFSVINSSRGKHSTIISLPNVEGKMEQFEVYEASNFDPVLQAKYPEIRAFSGKGITDKYATLKLSISPQGIQTMVFRTDKENEFIEPYSQDHTVYAVFKSHREKGKLAWTCSTDDQKLVVDVHNKIPETAKSSAGQLKVMRLAQSCNGEYANYFGASTAGNAADKALVNAAFNATLTRCNGVYERELGLHLNLVATNDNIIYCNPATDPYSTTLSQWNTQLQQAINTTLTGPSTTLAANNAAYDIGHMFGASGGGGNAGCIGCVCVNAVAAGTGATKGRGITSPADGIPQGDNFDIDYVVHEVGHQLGGNHTFSMNNEGSGVNMEVGSGITIMGYAGITGQDVAPHSIDKYHAGSIAQIQANLATKSCPVTTNISANNATPVANAGLDYTIPKDTPFMLSGSATDANAGDALTYSWEQYDNDTAAQTGAASIASPTKPSGPNFISYNATASPVRYFPNINSVIANSATTTGTGNDAGITTEALSSIARTLNFRLTVRDNAPYSSTAPIKVGQTNFDDMVVTVNGTAGPFAVTSPNTAVSLTAGSNQTITWNVAGTTSNGVNTPFVDIFLSTDGGLTYPIQLGNKVPNDGSEVVTIPNNLGSSNRIMVKGNQNVFFDISNTNFTIAAAAATFGVTQSSVQTQQLCPIPTSTSFTFNYTTLNGFSGTTTFSATGLPAGTSATFSPATMTGNGTVTMTINNLAAAVNGTYPITVNATSGSTTKTVPYYLYLGLNNPSLLTPVNNATAQNISLNLTWNAEPSATAYDVQVSTSNTFATIFNSGSSNTNSYSVSGLAQGTTYYWRVAPKTATCTASFGSPFQFTTGTITCGTTTNNTVLAIPNTVFTGTSTINIPAGGTISDVNVGINIEHTWINDLTVRLTSPGGTVVNLFANKCNPSASVNNVNATFDDAGTAIVCGDFPGISGTVIPDQALAAFNGQNSAGTWTLTVIDSFNQDEGQLNNWSLNICTLQPLATSDFEFESFNLYPNPNNGTFTIKLASEANNVKIIVNDIRGRQVFEKSYTNDGIFDQTINLNNVQAGVYLVTATDGIKKTVKRIIIQ